MTTTTDTTPAGFERTPAGVGSRRPTGATTNTRGSHLAFRAIGGSGNDKLTGGPAIEIGDLAAAFDPGTLAAMQYDAEQLAARSDETAGAWQALADALGEACVLAEQGPVSA